MSNLCCALNPVYECRSCGFQECNPCYQTRFGKGQKDYHIQGDNDDNSFCAITKQPLYPTSNFNPQYTIWHIKPNDHHE